MLRYISACAILSVNAVVSAQDCHNSKVVSPTPFLGNDGEIVKLADGSLWEIRDSYAYLYEYYPSIVICPAVGKLMVRDKILDVLSVTKQVHGRQTVGVIESTIAGQFNGLNRGNIYRFANGQIWEQTEAWIWAWTWANPRVMIYPGASGYQMKVENIDHAVVVRRIR